MSHRSEPLLGFSPSVFSARREKVLAALDGSALVLPGAPVALKSADTERRYRADSELFYLTGWVEPGALAVLRPDGENGSFVLFIQPRDEDAERWSGPRLGSDAAREIFGADEVYELGEVEKRLPPLLAGTDAVYFRMGSATVPEKLVIEALRTARRRGARKGIGPRAIMDPGVILDPLRLVKDTEEVDRMRRAASVTVDAFRDLGPLIRPGAGEWALEAALDSGFRKRGAWGPAYPTIVGSGRNACVLHYVANDRVLEEEELVLVDAGAELDLYAADITRTFPTSGRFSKAQRTVYDIVLGAHQRAVQAVRPGVTLADIHRIARDELIEGLLDQGILEGSKASVVEDESFKSFFPHQTSHWLGLDVHDVGDYEANGESLPLQPGMVLTVEPGLYFPAKGEGPDGTGFSDLGIRIEDDVLVTTDGHEVLTGALPVEADEIEELVRSRP